MKESKPVESPKIAPRPKQQMPDELVADLMAKIRGQFCGNMETAEWMKHSHFIRRNVVMWPAHFIFNKKGFTVSGARYKQIMKEIFEGIKLHGDLSSIRFWPGYLMDCVQNHFKNHWEDYYAESKAVTTIADHALMALKRATSAPDKTVEAIALAHRVLVGKRHKRAKKTGNNRAVNLSLNL